MEEFFETIRSSCSKQVWSQGVELVRRDAVTTDSVSPEEIILRVQNPETGVSPRVSLWPQDEDWRCECHSKDDPCKHVAAAVIALRQAEKRGEAPPRSKSSAGSVSYRFRSTPSGLWFERYIVSGDDEMELTVALSAITSLRIRDVGIGVSPTSLDMEIELTLGGQRRGVLSTPVMVKLMRLLSGCNDVRLDGAKIKTDAHPSGLQLIIEDDGPTVKVWARKDPAIDKTFGEAVALCGDVLRPLRKINLDHQQLEALRQGRSYAVRQAAAIVAELLPKLGGQFEIVNRSQSLPQLTYARPHIEIELTAVGQQLKVTPLIVYGRPELARVEQGRFMATGDEVPERDMGQEALLKDELWHKLAIELDRSMIMARDEAVAFVGKVKRHFKEDIRGGGITNFKVYGALRPEIKLSADTLTVAFSATADDDGELPTPRPAALEAVMAAYQRGESLVPLLDGGYAELPRDFFARHGARLLELLAVRDNDEKIPHAALPTLLHFCDDLGQNPPAALKELGQKLAHFEQIPSYARPPDLTATLRGYQQQGADWLAFLRALGFGALLADDMGLGKTLQTLTVIEERTLIVVPTSVLFNWQRELARFRPSLSVNVYYGAGRTLTDAALVTLTTYGLLRLEAERLQQVKWRMIILDEGQNIKNPQSQVTRAAYRLQGDFKVVLSGTPIENSLDDLWSQFNFINPGLLGSFKFFTEQVPRGGAAADGAGMQRLREKIKPFILRRLKSEVARELPPKIEMVLYAQLGEEDRGIYDAIYAATKQDVVERLMQGISPLQVLEAILRLRQVCCHSALLKGAVRPPRSAKLDVMLETVEQAIAEQHKVIIFSQWTSLLDLMEPALNEQHIDFLRLDGATRDRQRVVDAFQAVDGPPLLIMSLKAGGVGLNLTAADHVIIMDPWWNPAVEEQAIDRAHRIGQERPVLIHRIVAMDTIEERILLLQEEKRRLAQAALSGETVEFNLTKDDMMKLFAAPD